jgi:serine/threonine protein phosphatase PrpC
MNQKLNLEQLTQSPRIINAASTIRKNWKIYLLKKRVKFYSIVRRIQSFRRSASVCIQKWFRGHMVRKELPFIHKKYRGRLIRWKYDAKEVAMAGTFTKPTWEECIPLRYSRFLEEFISTYFIDVKIEPGVYFIKFIADGEWLCDGSLPISLDETGNHNNVITIYSEDRRIFRATSAKTITAREATSTERFAHNDRSESPHMKGRTMSGHLDSPIVLDFLNKKQLESELKCVKLVMAAHMIAHPKSRNMKYTNEGSADAYFIDELNQCFGLADGVGEWETFGLDPSLFSKELMQKNHAHFKRKGFLLSRCPETDVTAKLLKFADKAHNGIVSYGSSTMLIGYCRESNLYTVSLGDSGYIVLRMREGSKNFYTVHRSIEQQHSFNCPYQLAKLPQPKDHDKLLDQGMTALVSLLKKTKEPNFDTPSCADTQMICIRPGDIIIAATDGLFDNLYDVDIIRIVEHMSNKQLPAKKFCKFLARALAERAVDKGWDITYRSPFSKNAAKSGRRYIGGKLDDTTVIVGLAIPDTEPKYKLTV